MTPRRKIFSSGKADDDGGLAPTKEENAARRKKIGVGRCFDG
jgi:hypothetical protein